MGASSTMNCWLLSCYDVVGLFVLACRWAAGRRRMVSFGMPLGCCSAPFCSIFFFTRWDGGSFQFSSLLHPFTARYSIGNARARCGHTPAAAVAAAISWCTSIECRSRSAHESAASGKREPASTAKRAPAGRQAVRMRAVGTWLVNSEARGEAQ
jgi:hypothetical protein